MTHDISVRLLVPVSIFFTGFVAGLIFAIGLKTGIEPDEFGIGLFILQNFCTVIQNNSSLVTYNCNFFITIFIILSVVVTILSIIFQALRMDDFRVSLGIYFGGLVVGIITIFYFLR
ncbi:MAG TPA: hypothetical protein VNL34_00840 [Candidatus Nitrosotenuis sp.]|jgi:hypothetical protein|nr:hypothetical protein [Candidatus Nitrosotenuis sp.]